MNIYLLIIALLLLNPAFLSADTNVISKFKIKNGITIIHKQTSSNQIIALKLFLKNGIAHEPKEKSGISQLMQSLLMKGTINKDQSEISDLIEGMGGSISFSGNFDYLEGSLIIPKGEFKKALELFGEIIQLPKFDEASIQKEKASQINGLESRFDSIFTVADDIFREELYGTHPYSRIEAGSKETINLISKDDIEKIHKYFYQPENMLFVIVGDISKKKAKNYISKYFDGMKAINEKGLFDPVNEASPLISSKNKIVESDFNQSYIMMGYPAPNVNSNDYTVLKVVNSLLGGRMSSYLFQELREKKGLAYEISCFYPSRLFGSRFVIYMGLDRKNIDLAKENIKLILNNLKKSTLSNEELQDIKRYIKGTYLMGHQTNSAQAWYLGWWEVLSKGFKYDSNYIKDIDKVSPKDVQKCAEKYLDNKLLVIELHPKK
ncbi:MAG: pitrilysin family protein [bacterium]